MAILKQAKNIDIKVVDKYHLFVGKKLEKVAEKINIEATKKNLELISNKRILSKGNSK